MHIGEEMSTAMKERKEKKGVQLFEHTSEGVSSTAMKERKKERKRGYNCWKIFLLFALPRRGLFAGLDASPFVFI